MKGIAINEETKLGSRITEEGKLGSESHMVEFLLEVMEARQELENAETEEEVESIMSMNKGTFIMACVLGTSHSPPIVPHIRPDTGRS